MGVGIYGLESNNHFKRGHLIGGQFSIEEQLLYINVQRFRGWLVFKAHRLLYHSSRGFRVIKKKRREGGEDVEHAEEGERSDKECATHSM